MAAPGWWSDAGSTCRSRPTNCPWQATSLAASGADVSRARLLITALEQLAAANELWREAAYNAQGAGLLDTYRTLCATIGSDVRVTLPDGSVLEGLAEAIDDDGRLLLVTEAGGRPLTAGMSPRSPGVSAQGSTVVVAGYPENSCPTVNMSPSRCGRTGGRSSFQPSCSSPWIFGFFFLIRLFGDNTIAAWATVIVALFLIIVFAVRPFLYWITTQYVFTNRRIIVRSGLIARHGRDMPLSKVNNVSFDVSAAGRILNYGMLTIDQPATKR